MDKNKEISKLLSEKAIFEQQEEIKMDQFAKELNSGLGEQMMMELKNPETHIVVHKGFKYSFKKWWKKLKENFQIIFYSKEE